jgi:hypothetical protein
MKQEILIREYERGAISTYEFFQTAREIKANLPEEYRVQYEQWCQDHPEGPNMRSFCIVA